MRQGPEATNASSPKPTLGSSNKILIVIILTLFMTHVSINNINVLLPSIGSDLSASPSQIQWILSGYTLVFGVALIPAGRAGDFFERRTVFTLGIILFVISSIWAAFSMTPESLIYARLLQGAGSGFIMPQGLGLIQEHFSGAARGKAFGIYGAAVGIATASGPLIGGFIVSVAGLELGWRLTIGLNVPTGIIALIFALLWIPKKQQAKGFLAAQKMYQKLDLFGSLLIGLGVFAVMLPFVESSYSAYLWLTVPVGLILVWVWIVWEKKLERTGAFPMVKLTAFKLPSFRNGVTISSFYFMGFISIWIIIALYMQDGLGHSALSAALVQLPAAIVISVSAPTAGRLVSVYGRKVVIFGLYLTIIGFLSTIMVVQLVEYGKASEWWLLLTLSFLGAAQGSVISPNHTLTLAEVAPEESGSLGAVMQTGQRIGTTVGITIITAVLFLTLNISSWANAMTFSIIFMLAITLYVLWVAYRDQKVSKFV